jgi:hypothetical protein
MWKAQSSEAAKKLAKYLTWTHLTSGIYEAALMPGSPSPSRCRLNLSLDGAASPLRIKEHISLDSPQVYSFVCSRQEAQARKSRVPLVRTLPECSERWVEMVVEDMVKTKREVCGRTITEAVEGSEMIRM